MKLPNGDIAIVEIEKLRDYCLSSEHPRGRHKARVFLSRLEIGAAQFEELREALLNAAAREEASLGISDRYGIRYIIDFEWKRGERSAKIRSSWIVRLGETVPRFVTCFVL
jgi:hypothetical protein